jgi:hypothetical protein
MTAKEIYQKYSDKSNRIQEIHFNEMLVEFAKHHCEKQLKAILEKAEAYYLDDFGDEISANIDKFSIINAYNLNNIK